MMLEDLIFLPHASKIFLKNYKNIKIMQNNYFYKVFTLFQSNFIKKINKSQLMK